ncbi:MAG: hypothetical protein V9E88_15305 [Ferruginibacter sp.]
MTNDRVVGISYDYIIEIREVHVVVPENLLQTDAIKDNLARACTNLKLRLYDPAADQP